MPASQKSSDYDTLANFAQIQVVTILLTGFIHHIVATGCNRTQDRHSRENRPLKKGIQTGGK